MGGNVGPNSNPYLGKLAEMKCYDRLPKVLRRVVANAPYAYSAAHTLETLTEWQIKYGNDLTDNRIAQLLAEGLEKAYVAERVKASPLSVNFAPYKNIGY